MFRILGPCIVLLLLCLCDGSDHFVDVSNYDANAVFRGITITDQGGTVIQNDSTDWGCIDIYQLTPSIPISRAAAPSGIGPHHIIPNISIFAISPAFPNPCKTFFTFFISVPQKFKSDFYIIDNHYNKVKTFFNDDTLAYGQKWVFWDLTDNENIKVMPQIYRCILNLHLNSETIQLHGDIWIQSANTKQ
jgi:hypothetical protein